MSSSNVRNSCIPSWIYTQACKARHRYTYHYGYKAGKERYMYEHLRCSQGYTQTAIQNLTSAQCKWNWKGALDWLNVWAPTVLTGVHTDSLTEFQPHCTVRVELVRSFWLIECMSTSGAHRGTHRQPHKSLTSLHIAFETGKVFLWSNAPDRHSCPSPLLTHTWNRIPSFFQDTGAHVHATSCMHLALRIAPVYSITNAPSGSSAAALATASRVSDLSQHWLAKIRTPTLARLLSSMSAHTVCVASGEPSSCLVTSARSQRHGRSSYLDVCVCVLGALLYLA